MNIFMFRNMIFVQSYLDSILLNGCPAKHFALYEVSNMILKYFNEKYPGFDIITTEVARF